MSWPKNTTQARTRTTRPRDECTNESLESKCLYRIPNLKKVAISILLARFVCNSPSEPPPPRVCFALDSHAFSFAWEQSIVTKIKSFLSHPAFGVIDSRVDTSFIFCQFTCKENLIYLEFTRKHVDAPCNRQLSVSITTLCHCSILRVPRLDTPKCGSCGQKYEVWMLFVTRYPFLLL